MAAGGLFPPRWGGRFLPVPRYTRPLSRRCPGDRAARCGVPRWNWVGWSTCRRSSPSSRGRTAQVTNTAVRSPSPCRAFPHAPDPFPLQRPRSRCWRTWPTSPTIPATTSTSGSCRCWTCSSICSPRTTRLSWSLPWVRAAPSTLSWHPGRGQRAPRSLWSLIRPKFTHQNQTHTLLIKPPLVQNGREVRGRHDPPCPCRP